jgi:hypothetical protein
MGNYNEFGCALWATTEDLVIGYGPLRRMRLYSTVKIKICIGFCDMDHSAGFGYALWAIAQGLVFRYGMGHIKGFG